MVSDTEAAAERPRELPEPNIEIFDDNGEVWCWCKTEETSQHLCKALTEYDREHDTDLVDEAFARSVGEEHEDGIGVAWHVSDVAYFRICGMGQMVFKILGECELVDPTIGDFYTACRLFRVELKHVD